MKKAESGDRDSAAKKAAKKAPKKTVAANDVDKYLARVPEPARNTLNKIRATIRSAVPAEATEAISYGIPAFKYKGPLVAYAAFKNHCSFFPLGSAVLEEFKDELEPYRMSKGTLHFPVDRPLPATLVKKMVKARIAMNERNEKR
jgi:uncharacterized protein YdhG (YjbR/CyaY superfamily)